MAGDFSEGWIHNSWQDRLDRLLDRLSDFDVLLLEAPAGFGKRRTIERWHHLLVGSNRSVFRLDCARKQTVWDGAPDPALPSERWHSDPAAARAIVANFCQAGDDGRVLIVENLHDLDADDQDYLATSLANLPPVTNTLLTSQSMPKPWSAPLVASGQMQILCEDQLALNFDEFSERLQMICDETFHLSTRRNLFGVTGGWSIAIEHVASLIIQSPDRLKTAEDFPPIWSRLIDWIHNRVWLTLSSDEQSFLLGLAVLGHTPLDPRFVCNFMGTDAAGEELQALAARTPLFQRDERSRLSLRPLAVGFLQEIAQSRSRRADLHRKAARLLESRTDYHAIGHILAAGDVARACSLLDRTLLDLVAEGQNRIARQWLDVIPNQQLRNSSTILAIALLGDAGLARSRLAEPLQLMERSTPAERKQAVLIKAALAAAEDDLDALKAALETIENEDELDGRLKAVHQLLVLQYGQQMGRAQPFTSTALAVDDERRKPENFGLYCDTVIRDGLILLQIGQAEAAVRLVTRMRILASEKLGEDAIATIELGAIQGAAHLQSGQMNQARAVLTPWAMQDLEGVSSTVLQIGQIGLARLAAMDERHVDALAIIPFSFRSGHQQAKVLAHFAREAAHIALSGGLPHIVRQVEANLQEIVAQTDGTPSTQAALARLSALSGLAEISMANGQWSSALEQLEEAIAFAMRFERLFELAKLTYMKNCCVGAVRTGVFATDVAFAPIGDADIETIIMDVERLRRSTSREAERSRAARADGEADTILLTQKEREVLELMARGFSKPLIAQALKISPETVKWHQKNIYTKFDIHDRHHVLSQARTMGLV